MAEDKIRRALQALDRREEPAPTDPGQRLWALVSSIHRDPQLREWITLESSSLLPFLQRRGDGWIVNVLVSAVMPSREVRAPWALLAWSWPDARLLAMVDVRDDIASMEVSMPSGVVCTEAHCVSLMAELEEGRDPLDPAELTPVYQRLLQRPLARDHHRLVEAPNRAATAEPPPAQPPSPVLTLKELIALLNDSREALADGELSDLLPRLRRIRGLLDDAHFSVAVAGEFSRGKSTLINKLVGEELLSVGDLPTTAVPACLRHGAEGVKFFRSHDGRRKEVSLSAETSGRTDDESVDGVYEIRTPAEWLRESGIQLIDTPGVGAPDDARSVFATEAIATSDATLIAVSGTMALSLTERSFIEQEVLGDAIPRVAVVVTRLDQVSEDARSRVVEHVTQSVTSWAPEAEVWASFAEPILPHDANIQVAGVAAMRQRLSEWAAAPEHHSRRLAQVQLQLDQLLEAAQSTIQLRYELAERAKEDDAQMLRQALMDLDREGLRWERIRTEFARREAGVTAWLEEKLREGLENVADRLTVAVSQHPEPRLWWEELFPLQFKTGVNNHLVRLEGELQRRINADAGWLRSAMVAEFKWETDMVHQGRLLEAGPNSGPGATGFAAEDIGRHRNIGRAGTALVAAAAYMLAGPLGLVVSAGGGLANEALHKKKLSDQQAASARAVRRLVEDRADDICLAGTRRLQGAYRKLEALCKREQEQWRKIRAATAREVAEAPDRDELLEDSQQLLRRLNDLRGRNTPSHGA